MSPDTDRGAELPVPDEAFDGVADLLAAGFVDMAAVYAIVRPVVAAELRRLAEDWDERRYPTTPRAMTTVLRARADHLAPDSTTPSG